MKKAAAPKLTYGPARRSRGRPRSFNREQALDAAMNVFWSKGYEGASLSELTEAMGINPPSLYAAFGDKEGLFVEAVRRYHSKVQETCPYQDQPTAREAIERLLVDLASIFTDPNHPKGCLAVMAATTSSAAGPKLQELLADQRNEAKARLRERISRGVKDGDLAPDTDVHALTNFYAAVINGMSLQARDGVTRKGLLSMVDTAMRAWPEAPKQKKVKAAA